MCRVSTGRSLAADAQAALDRLTNLDEGWVDGNAGEAMSTEVVDRAVRLIDTMKCLGNVAESVFPTEQGGVRFYWPRTENQLTVEVEPSGTVYVHAVDTTVGTHHDETLSTDADLTERLAPWLGKEGCHR